VFSIVYRPTRRISQVKCGQDHFGSRKHVQKFVCIILTDHKQLCTYKWNCWLPSNFSITVLYQSQWTRGLKRGSAAARLLGLWFRIPPMHWCLSLVSIVCYLAEASTTGRSLLQSSRTECGVSECYLENSVMRRRWSSRGCCARGEKNHKTAIFILIGLLYILE
jgi:hypothetical protein